MYRYYERRMKMLNYYTIDGFNIPTVFDQLQIIKTKENGGEIITECNFQNYRKKIKENMREIILKPEHLKRMVVNNSIITHFAYSGTGGAYTTYTFMVDGEEIVFRAFVPLGIFLELDKVYGFTELKNEGVLELNMPADKSVFRFVVKVGGKNPDFFIGSIDIKGVKNLDDTRISKDGGYQKDVLYITGSSAFVYVGKAYKPSVSLITSKDKQTKKLVWRNKWNETNLFVSLTGHSITINDTKEVFKKQISGKDIDEKFKKEVVDEKKLKTKELLASFGVWYYGCNLDAENSAMQKGSLFRYLYDASIKRMNNQPQTLAMGDMLKMMNQFSEDNMNNIVKNLATTGEIEVKIDDETDLSALKSLQKKLNETIFLEKEEVTMKKLFEKHHIDVDNFIFDEKDIVSGHAYKELHNFDDVMCNIVFVDKCYCPKYMVEKAKYTNKGKLSSEDEILEKYLFVKDRGSLIYDVAKDLTSNNKTVESFKMVECSKVFPLYDVGKHDYDIAFKNELFKNQLMDAFTSANISMLQEMFNLDGYRIVSNDGCLYIQTVDNSLYYENVMLENILERFNSIGSREKKEMEKVLNLFTDSDALITYLKKEA